jgi:Ni,Fe-hydrogenase maturation factor
LPEQITIFAIHVQNVDEFGEQPTPAVAAAIPLVTQAVLEEILQD